MTGPLGLLGWNICSKTLYSLRLGIIVHCNFSGHFKEVFFLKSVDIAMI